VTELLRSAWSHRRQRHGTQRRGVDRCRRAETAEAAAFRFNANWPRKLAEACRRTDTRLVHLSTDHVFSGDAGMPYREDAEPSPRTAYGRSKLTGGPSGAPGRVVRRQDSVAPRRAREQLRAAGDSPGARARVHRRRRRPTRSTSARELGCPAGRFGHCGRGAGRLPCGGARGASWYELAQAVFVELGADQRRLRTTTNRFCGRRHDRRTACSDRTMARDRAAADAALAGFRCDRRCRRCCGRLWKFASPAG
jgi:dTDP-4-dehydrorhamnose reductase